MRRYIYIYMLFLACGLFDTSSGASSSEAVSLQASPEEQEVRDAFAEFDKACEEYYKMSADVREWIYVDQKITNKDHSNRGKELELKDIQEHYNKNSDKTKKTKALRLYYRVTEAEQKLNELNKNPISIDAFYKVVKERYNTMPEEVRDLMNKESKYTIYYTLGKLSIYKENFSRTNYQIYSTNGEIFGFAKSDDLWIVLNNHKIDSDLRLHGWFVEAEGRRTAQTGLTKEMDDTDTTGCLSCLPSIKFWKKLMPAKKT